MLDILKSNIDSFGVITQDESQNFDGGDTLQREGFFAYVSKEEERFLSVLDKVEINKSGNYLRHPDTSKWYGTPYRISRDQITPVIISLGKCEDKSHLKRIFFAHLKRALLFTNNIYPNWTMPGDSEYRAKLPDVTGPAIWGMYIRSFKVYPLYPLLYLFDVEIMINSIIKLWNTKHDPKNCDDANHIITLQQSYDTFPTLISFIARRLYSKRNPQLQLNTYFRPEAHGPALNKAWEQTIKDTYV